MFALLLRTTSVGDFFAATAEAAEAAGAGAAEEAALGRPGENKEAPLGLGLLLVSGGAEQAAALALSLF